MLKEVPAKIVKREPKLDYKRCMADGLKLQLMAKKLLRSFFNGVKEVARVWGVCRDCAADGIKRFEAQYGGH